MTDETHTPPADTPGDDQPTPDDTDDPGGCRPPLWLVIAGLGAIIIAGILVSNF